LDEYDREFRRFLRRTKDPCYWVERVEKQLEKLGDNVSSRVEGGHIYYTASKDNAISIITLKEDDYRRCMRKRRIRAALRKPFVLLRSLFSR